MRFASRRAGVAFLAWATLVSGVSFAQSDTFVTNDPIRAQLLAMGKPGVTVAAARDHVIEILQSPNSCSAWFQDVDPNVLSTFASLKFIIDTNGPHQVLSLQTHPGEMLLKHPYSATAAENAGAHSFVVLNAKGAFFVSFAAVLQQEDTSGLSRPSGWRYLLVGSYRGDTLAAQITILLHELGHVVGRLPEDSDEWSGQSGRNTAEVLRFCRAQIKAASAVTAPKPFYRPNME
jgi:hypothetical protein